MPTDSEGQAEAANHADQVEPEPEPTIHEATLPSGGCSGEVLWGNEISLAEAVARRRAGKDVVVRGENPKLNSRVAEQIEAAVGRYIRCPFHAGAGPRSLPHYHQASRVPDGHSFYEAKTRKARKMKPPKAR